MNRKRLYPRTIGLLWMLSCFLGMRAQSGLEYWFDSYTNPRIIGMPGGVGTLESNINVSDLSQGFHTIYMRAKSSDCYSPITSSTFLKFNASGDSKLEYWFDDNVSKRASTTIDVESGVVQLLDLDLTNETKFPLGFHQLNMRVVAYGGHYSPVYSAYVMRLPKGDANQITYWLDDDYANRRVMKGIPLNAKNTFFIGNLDFSTTPVGMHRFKYRVTANGFDEGVVYDVPVLITKMYNNVTEATIVSESYWFNENTPNNKEVSNPQPTYVKTYVLNPENYAVGQYAFHVQYKNSADVWGVPNVTYFYKEESGMLRVGFMPGGFDGMEEETIDEHFICTNQEGMIFVDCQSSKLASTGIIMVYDMTGKVVAQKDVCNMNGIHTEISTNGISKQLLIVRLLSGDAQFTKKIMIK